MGVRGREVGNAYPPIHPLSGGCPSDFLTVTARVLESLQLVSGRFIAASKNLYLHRNTSCKGRVNIWVNINMACNSKFSCQ